MKIFVSALALLLGSNVMALAAEHTLKFKLVYFNLGAEKGGEYHMIGATLAPDGTIGTKDFYDKPGDHGDTGHSTYYFPNGSIIANYAMTTTGTKDGGHMIGTYEIVSGTGDYQGATGTGKFEGDWGDKSPLKAASGLLNVELDVKTP